MPHHLVTLPPCHLATPRPAYSITRKTTPPPPSTNWHDPYWSNVPALPVSNFYFRSTRHHPQTLCKVAYTTSALHLFFHVRDRFLRCKQTELHSPVFKDSCVECFLRPRPELPLDRGGGYFNFEINCAGILNASYIENPKKVGIGFVKFHQITPAQARQITILPSLHITPPPPTFLHAPPLTWTLQCSIPLSLLEHFVGPLRPLAAQTWHANFFKCADRSKYPHWAAWSPIGRPPNFHQPHRFGTLYFRKLPS